ncbi:MAG: hypothetical protein WCT37_05690 [Patescibacteria group bacterium]|jgi:hypothetical protein
MNYPQARNIHRPKHLLLDGEIYFVSCRTIGKRRYFIGKNKEILRSSLIKAIAKYRPLIYAWARYVGG